MSFVLIISLHLLSTDFPICTATYNQCFPCPVFENNQYYVFWTDFRDYYVDTTVCLYGARILSDGTVIDPDGKLLFKRQASHKPAVAYDGTNFLVVFRDSC